VTRHRGDGDKTLAAFVVPRPGASLSWPALRSWLGEKLPDYMVPAHFFILPALPLTPNGKVDRQALEQLEGEALASGTEYVAPRNELESQLVAIWQEVLRLDRIGIHDDFFALGGHSLLAIALSSRLSALCQRSVPLRWIFEHPTLEALARRIETNGPSGPAWAAIPVVDRHEPLPMSFGQQRMWLLQQTLPDPATYHVPVVYQLQGSVAVDRLRSALQVILERHEVLRTALVQTGEALVQKILPATDVPLPWVEVDGTALPEGEIERRLNEEVRRPFDLNQAPLWRALWIQLAGNARGGHQDAQHRRSRDGLASALSNHEGKPGHSVTTPLEVRVRIVEADDLVATRGPPRARMMPPQGRDHHAVQKGFRRCAYAGSWNARASCNGQPSPPSL